MSKYKLLRDSMQELKREASEKGGLNPRAQMIIDLIADYEAMQAQVAQLEIALAVVKTVLESDDPAIADTIWVPDHVSQSETLYDYICSALATLGQQKSEQLLLKSAPPEPTARMCEAGASVLLKNGQSEADWVGDIYRAMISKAESEELPIPMHPCIMQLDKMGDV